MTDRQDKACQACEFYKAYWFTHAVKAGIDPRLTSLEKLERTLTADLTALGLNYNSTVSKMKEDAASGVDTEKDGLTKLLVEARDSMNEVPEL